MPTLSFGGEGLNYGGSVNVAFNFKFAYDTHGLRELINDLTNGSNPSVGTMLLDVADGFYIADSSSLSMSGAIGIGAGASLAGVASASIGGYVGTGDAGSVPITINMNDPDQSTDGGKYRLEKFITTIANGNDPFQASGELDATLAIKVSVGVNLPIVGFVGYQHTFDIGDVVLYDFNPPPPAPPQPVLASQPDANGQVTLYIGQDAALRSGPLGGPVTTTDGNENYTITHVGDVPNSGGEIIDVTAFGLTQTIQGVKSIVGTGDVGDLTVDVQAGVEANVTIHGGQGHAYLTYDGSGNANLYAGHLDSTLVGGLGVNSLNGGPGNDTLVAGRDRTSSMAAPATTPSSFKPTPPWPATSSAWFRAATIPAPRTSWK